jgi:hypothetical protein
MTYLNLRDGLVKKLDGHEYFALCIDFNELQFESGVYHQTSIAFINDKPTRKQMDKADDEVREILEFKL